MVIDELIAILGYDVRGEAELNRFNKGMERASMLAQRLAAVMVAAGTVAAGTLFAFGKGIIDTSAKFEGFETSLETIEGSAEKAKQSMDWITKFAAKTPYDLDGVTRAFIKLKTYGIDPTDGTLTTLGDTASAMNKPLDQAVEAFADATSFQFERLREFGLIANQKGNEVTFQWTKNGKTLTKVVKKNGADIQKFIKGHFGSTFNGAMLRQSKTWDGMMANLGDSWELFKKRIGYGGFFEAAKRRLAGLLDYIGELDDNGTLDRWAQNLSDMFEGAIDSIGMVFDRIKRAVTQVSDFLSEHDDLLVPLKWAFLALMAIAFPTAAAVAAVGLAIEDLLTYLRGGDSVFGDFVESMKKLMPSLKDIPEQIKALDFHGVGKSLGKAIVEGLSGIGSAIAEKVKEVDWKEVFRLWAGAIKAEIDFFTGIFRGIGEAIGKALVEALKGTANDITEWFQSLLPDWAAEFFDFRKAKQEGTVAKAKEEGDRRRFFEEQTAPRGGNTPGLQKTLDQVREAQSATDQKARFARWGDMAENARINSQRAAGGPEIVQSVVNDNSNRSVTTNTSVALTVQQVTEAATAAANAVRDKVSSALSKVPSHPTRTTPSPTF